MRRVLAISILSGASVVFAFRFTPPQSGAITADDPAPYEVITTTTRVSPGVTATPLPPLTTTTTLPLPPGVRVIEGPLVRMNRGIVQVTITLEYGTLTDVEMTRYPTSDRRATQISLDAEPMLEEEALESQSADIHIVSGATETSHAYIKSLREALQEARISSDR
jgi:hypothetical protein